MPRGGAGGVRRKPSTTFLNSGSLVGSGDGLTMMEDMERKLTISKMDAARRQLRTAITEWFGDGEPVSIHTLACAAYEIIHSLSLKRNPIRRDLLFDTDYIKDEHRKDWLDLLRKPANFFKHADRDGDSDIEFNPAQSDAFILFSIIGIQLCGEQNSPAESAWLTWLCLHRPKYLSEKGREIFTKNIPIESLDYAKSMSKKDYFGSFCEASHMIAAGKTPPGRLLPRQMPRRTHRIQIPPRIPPRTL
jgi:hypothetical protein